MDMKNCPRMGTLSINHRMQARLSRWPSFAAVHCSIQIDLQQVLRRELPFVETRGRYENPAAPAHAEIPARSRSPSPRITTPRCRAEFIDFLPKGSRITNHT